MNELGEPTLQKKYLLGQLENESIQREIEERLMIDEEFAAEVGVIEEELIEAYLDGEMSAAESDSFKKFFLAPPQRKRQFRLTRDLRRVSALQATADPHPTRSLLDQLFPIGWLRFSAVATAILIVAFGVWRFAIYESITDKGLNELRAAFRGQRPFEPRVTGLPEYAPYSDVRGDQAKVTDPSSLNRAGLFFAESTRDSADALAHQALATYHLARGELSDAEREIKIALQSSPNDVTILNDAAAIYLEKAKKERDAKDDAKELIALNESMTHLERAITLDPKKVDLRFNRALALEALRNTEEAKAAWRTYLEYDANSKWAQEARRHLEKLESETPTERSAEQVEADFVAAVKEGKTDAAEKLMSSNRELIRDKYLPVRLAMSYVAMREDRRNDLLRALERSGEIEMKLMGDPFAKEIAFFYRTVPEEKWLPLRGAHASLRQAMTLCRDQKYKDCLPHAAGATKAFDELGDPLTAKIAKYFLGYALVNLRYNDEAYAEMKAVEKWATERKFLWLKLTALHWVGSCLFNSKRLTESRLAFEEALAIAERTGDSYSRQRNMSLLAQVHSVSGQQNEALKYLFAAVKESDKPETSLRQRFRNFFFVFPILFQAGLLGAGKPAAMEVMRLADQQKDQNWIAQSRAFAGIATAQMGDVASARSLLEESREKASAIEDLETRDRVRALANLRSGDFERLFGNVRLAEGFYVAALQYYSNASPMLREEAQQGLLESYLATGNTRALEEQISESIRLAEEYRPTIFDEAQKIGFFDLKSNVYDVAAEFEFDKGNLESGYEYVEKSSSRALFDRMLNPANRAGENTPPARPLGLSEIRAQIPSEVAVVQYSVFDKKTVVWIISRDAFKSVSINISAADLSARVSQFSRAISNASGVDAANVDRLGRELHEVLIAPLLQHIDPNAELCIVPSKFLFDLPFAGLTDADGRPLIATFRLVHAPSANVFILGTRNAAARGRSEGESILAIGNPSFDRKRFEGLSPLPDSEEEVRRISKVYPHAETMVRENATKAAFLASVPNADVIHFAGHYVALPGTPMSSFLLFAGDGDNTASELSNAELSGVAISRARLIVLAACQSGIESYYRSEGMAGMSRTMLAAQVPLVVASQWSVESAATAELMIRFHELRQKGHLSTTAALRAAQLELLHDPSGRFSSPYYWAAFAVYGGHADF